MICYCCSFWSSAQVFESHNAAELGCNRNTAAHEQRPWGREPCLSWTHWKQVREDAGFWLELRDSSQVVVKHQICRVTASSTKSWVLCRQLQLWGRGRVSPPHPKPPSTAQLVLWLKEAPGFLVILRGVPWRCWWVSTGSFFKPTIYSDAYEAPPD